MIKTEPTTEQRPLTMESREGANGWMPRVFSTNPAPRLAVPCQAEPCLAAPSHAAPCLAKPDQAANVSCVRAARQSQGG